MKQVVQSARTGEPAVREPRLRDGHLLVRSATSLISAGTERLATEVLRESLAGEAEPRRDPAPEVMEQARLNGPGATIDAVMARLDEPLPLGCSAAGTVVAVGPGLEGRFRVGQRVAVAGVGFADHAEVNAVPGSLAVPVPDDVNDEEACFGTLGAIALHGVRNLAPRLGESVAVIGAGLVGQMAIQFLVLSGVRVIALDYDAGRLELARYGGAELCWNLADGDPVRAVRDLTGGLGCDGVLIAAATESGEPLATAAALARDRARISLVGPTGAELPYREFMRKELMLVVSRSYGPGRYDADRDSGGMACPDGCVRWTETRNLEEAVRLMSRRSDRRLAVEPLITHRLPIDRAAEAYGMIAERSEPHLGVVLTYPPERPPRAPRLRIPAHVSAPTREGACVLGVIGGGNSPPAVLLPRLASATGCRLHTIVTRRGAAEFGFETASTDEAAVFENPDINAVLIATPHSTHADLVVRALAAGKNVLVEGPLALNRDELDRVVKARNRSEAFFQVGFNRRFAPQTMAARDLLDRAGARKFVLIRVNAGAPPVGSRQDATEDGAGGILGDLCHFVDLARFLADARIATVHATAATGAGPCADVNVALSFADGGLATVAYTAMGDTAYSRERVECYAGGAVATIEDFGTLTVVRDGTTSRPAGQSEQDKGHAAELDRFVAAVAARGPAPAPEAELIESSLATIAVLESLQGGATVQI